MIIASDIDDVLAHFGRPASRYFNEVFGRSIAFEEIYSVQVHRVWSIPAPHVRKPIDDFLERHVSTLEPYEGCVEGLHQLRAQGHELHALTSRPAFVESRTREWLERHTPDLFSKCHVTNQYGEGQRTTKHVICQAENIEILIDDNPEYVFDCHRAGVKVVVFDQPWNRKLKLKEGMVRARGWNEVVPAVNSLLN